MNQFTTAEIRSEANNWSGLNQAGYSNPAVDQLYAQYSKELDVAKRQALYAGFMKQVADQTGVRIVPCTGIYSYDFLPHYFANRDD